MNSKSTMNQQKVDDELKKLAMEYIKATNDHQHSLAEQILHDMETFKKLVESNVQNTA